MSTPAGALRESVTIERNDRERVGAGWQDNWTEVATVRAKVTPVHGGEAFRQGVERSTQFYRVLLRFRPDVEPEMRLLWKGRHLAIRAVGDPDDLGRELLVTAEHGVPT